MGELTLEQRLNEDLKTSLKKGDTLHRSVVQMIRSQILLEKKKGQGSEELDDEKVMRLIQSHAKKVKDALEHAEKADRADLVEQSRRELEIAESYLPSQLSDDALESIVQKAVANQSETGPKAMGAVMKAVMSEAQGQADGKRVQEAVRKALGM